MTTASENLGHLALLQILQVTLVLTAVGACTIFCCRRRPHLAYLLWLVALTKCVTPPLWSSPTSVFSWFERTNHATVATSDMVNLPTTKTEASQPLRNVSSGPTLPADRQAEVNFSPAEPPQPRNLADHAFSITALLGAIWSAGALLYALWVLIGAIRCRRAMRETAAIDEQNLQSLLMQLRRQMNLRRPVRLCVARQPIGPLTYGWLRPVIVLPQELVAARSAEELEPLMAHELVHIRRGDALVGWLQVAAQCLWWFHPLIWWANRQISYERERSCDEEVVAGFGFQPAQYARSLLGVLDLKLQMRWLSTLPGIRPLEITKQRLEHVMLHASRFQERMPRWYWLVAVVALLLLAPGAPLNTKAPQAVAAEDQNQAATDTSPAKSGEKSPSPHRQRAATPTGKLLDKLEEQNASTALWTDAWLRTLKTIADQGPAAVPELTAELDATDDDKMLRCMAFSLRAIGDKRAVPALIRAIPKTLRPPGSDMGLGAKDPALVKFAQQYALDHSQPEPGNYGFGRPVREVFGALKKLTGQEFDEQQIYFIFLDGTETQCRMQRDLYYRTAKQWADWWEQHAADFVQDPAYAHVGLAEPMIGPAPVPKLQAHYKTGNADDGSGAIAESVFNPKARFTFFDLDTGRVAPLPKKWRDGKDIEAHLDEITAWAAHEGFDLMGSEYTDADGHRHYAIRPIGMQVWELSLYHWKMESNDVTIDELKKEGTPIKDWLLHRDPQTGAIDPKSIASFLYITREGTSGLLDAGVEVTDDSLKPGGAVPAEIELLPVGFFKGRRFGVINFEELNPKSDAKNASEPSPADKPAAEKPADDKPAVEKSSDDKKADDSKTADAKTAEEKSGAAKTADGDEHGSEMLRKIRRDSAPLLKSLADEHGYRLATDEVLVRIAPPFAKTRQDYYEQANPTQAKLIPAGPSAMVFRWRVGQLSPWGMTFSSQDNKGYSLGALLDALLGLKGPRVDCPRDLLDKYLPGDWVVRSGANDAEIVVRLAAILHDELSLPVKLEFREVPRPVYVVSGEYQFTPLPGHKATEKTILTDKTVTTDVIEIFGKELVPHSGAGGGMGKFSEFLDWVGDWIGAPMVSDVKNPPTRQLMWRLNARYPSTQAMLDKDHDPKLVLEHLTAQTGLQFRQEQRPVRILFIEPAK